MLVPQDPAAQEPQGSLVLQEIQVSRVPLGHAAQERLVPQGIQVPQETLVPQDLAAREPLGKVLQVQLESEERMELQVLQGSEELMAQRVSLAPLG